MVESQFDELEAYVVLSVSSKINITSLRDVWLTDSACTNHMTPRREWFQGYRPIEPCDILMGDNSKIQAVGVGTILIRRLINNEWFDGKIEKVLHVPSLKKNLFATGLAVEKGFGSCV